MASDNNHKYYKNKKGQDVIRVTEVIKVLSKEQLIFWANMLGFKKISYKKELERVANIGSCVHELVDQFTDDKQLAVYQFSKFDIYNDCDKKFTLNALASFIKWYKKNKSIYKVIDKDFQLVNDDMGGTIDCAIESPFTKNKVVLIDYKTSSDFYLTMFLQLCGYVILYEDNYGKDLIDGIGIMRLDKKCGKIAQVKIIRYSELEPYLEGFRLLMNTAISMRKLEKSWSNDTINL